MHAIVFSLVFYLNTVEPHRTPSGPAILIFLCKLRGCLLFGGDFQ